MAGSFFDPRRSLEQRRKAAVNMFDFVVRGGMSDQRRMPSQVIDEGLKRTLHRYDPVDDGQLTGLPVLLVPPLGAPATCMDLRRGCSLAEHLVSQGRPAYLVDYGSIGFADKSLGLEHWIADVVPASIRAVSADRDGAAVQLVGWCMGGLFCILAAAAFEDLPISAIAMVASPFDFRKVPLVAPVHRVEQITGGHVVGTAVRAMGGLPARLVGLGFKATSLPTYVKKPVTIFSHRDDREFLAQIEAVDALMDSMYAYPGRALGQAYHRLFRKNELASGKVAGPTRVVDLADVRVPVMNVAGSSDVLAPPAAVHAAGPLLPNAPEVRLETAPGGHLGVLTGRSAAATTWALIDDFFATQKVAVRRRRASKGGPSTTSRPGAGGGPGKTVARRTPRPARSRRGDSNS